MSEPSDAAKRTKIGSRFRTCENDGPYGPAQLSETVFECDAINADGSINGKNERSWMAYDGAEISCGQYCNNIKSWVLAPPAEPPQEERT